MLEHNGLIYKDSFTSKYSLVSKIFQLNGQYKENLNKELNLIRTQCFILDLEELELRLNCIASPIKNSVGEAIGDISISTPSSRFNKDLLNDMKIKLLIVCNEISNKI